MNRQNFYNGLLVSNAEMELLQDNIESADKEIQKLIGCGILSGLSVSENTTPDRNIIISPGLAIFQDGSRAVLKTEIVLDLTSYIPTGAIPNSNKKYILITIKPGRYEYDARQNTDDVSVFYRKDEGYSLIIYQSTIDDTPVKPDIPSGEYALADILLSKDQLIIIDSEINQSRKIYYSPLVNQNNIDVFFDTQTGKFKESALPAITITNAFPVSSEAEMLALVCEIGDVAIRSDTGESFILRIPGPSVLSHWILNKTVASNSDKLGGKTESQLVVADTEKAFGLTLNQLRDVMCPIGFPITQYPSSTGFTTKLPGDTLKDFNGNLMTYSQLGYASQSELDTAKSNCMWPGTTWKLAIKPANFERQSLTRLDNNNKTIGAAFGTEQEHQGQGHFHKLSIESTSSFGGGTNVAISTHSSTISNLIMADNNRAQLIVTDGTNGTPNIGIETRPSATCVFKWVRTA